MNRFDGYAIPEGGGEVSRGNGEDEWEAIRWTNNDESRARLATECDMPLTADETKLKKLLKAAVVEVLEERRDLVRDALADAVEDIALVKAIAAGSRSKAITRAEVFKILRKDR